MTALWRTDPLPTFEDWHAPRNPAGCGLESFGVHGTLESAVVYRSARVGLPDASSPLLYITLLAAVPAK